MPLDPVILNTKAGSFTKSKIQDYYFLTPVRESIFEQTRDRHIAYHFIHPGESLPVMRRHLTNNELSWLVHHEFDAPEFEDGKPFWQLERDSGDSSDPLDWSYVVTRSLVEVVPEVHDNKDLEHTDYLVVDLDPKGDVDHEKVKEVADKVYRAIEDNIPSRYMEIRFSGGRGYHICAWLPCPRSFEELREKVKSVLASKLEPVPYDEAVKRGASLSLCGMKNTRARTDFIYIDCGAIARHRCVRALGGLHWKSGRACVRVGPPEKLEKFNPAMSGLQYVEKYPALIEFRNSYSIK